MTDPDMLLEADSLRKVYRPRGRHPEVVAVDDVSFALRRGASLGIVGESGSGKTTVANILMGLERATAGTVTIDGRVRGGAPRGARARRRAAKDVQIVFQNPYQSLDPRQSVLQSVAEPLAIHFRMASRERVDRARELLAQVGLDERVALSRPQQLSGGQRQRVAIARALAVRPRIVILDEAVASLDVSVQAQALNLIADIRKREQLALIVITHDLAVANQICDDLVVLRSGRVVESGKREQVLLAPQHPYTRLLRAAVPTQDWTPPRLRDMVHDAR